MTSLKRAVFIGIAVAASSALSLALLYTLVPAAARVLRPALIEHLLLTLPPEERQEIYDELARHTPALWDTTPDPRVGRLAKRNVETVIKQAEVVTNNAGMRSSLPFSKKREGVYRIICLGDSFVFGTGGPEDDRFCDRLGDYYAGHSATIDGARPNEIETLAVGLGGWTTVQETAYLSHRITSYEPDLIVALTVANDITTNDAVTGAGVYTRTFSTEQRRMGNGVFTNVAGQPLGVNGYTALTTDLSPAGRQEWRRAMRSLKSLVELQQRREEKILLALLDITGGETGYFHELYKHYVDELKIEAPYIVTSYFTSPETRLPHDGHPNRRGHELLRNHLVHALDALKWIELPAAQLPPLDPRLSLEISPPTSRASLAQHRSAYISKHLRQSLRFDALSHDEIGGLLGGLLPAEPTTAGSDSPAPWASVRSGFLLRAPANGDPTGEGREHRTRDRSVEVEIWAPPLPELFPMEIEMDLDGRPAGHFALASPSHDGRHRLSASASTNSLRDGVVEVVLRCDSYFSTIEDQRMLSFQLRSARIH